MLISMIHIIDHFRVSVNVGLLQSDFHIYVKDTENHHKCCY